jgi:hypothetical protein
MPIKRLSSSRRGESCGALHLCDQSLPYGHESPAARHAGASALAFGQVLRRGHPAVVHEHRPDPDALTERLLHLDTDRVVCGLYARPKQTPSA